MTKGTAWEISFWWVETVQLSQFASQTKMPVGSSRLCLSVLVRPSIRLRALRPSRRPRPSDEARALKTRPFNLSIPEIQWKFARRKSRRGAEEGRSFIEDHLDGVWSSGWSTKTSFKLSHPKNEKGGKERGGDVDQTQSCGALHCHCRPREHPESRVCASVINRFIQSGYLHPFLRRVSGCCCE